MKSVALHPISKVTSIVAIPGSKSYTNRALLIAAMTNNPVTIWNPLISDDTNAMVECLEKLGIRCEFNPSFVISKEERLRNPQEISHPSGFEMTIKPQSIEVINSIADIKEQNYQLNAHLSGTTIRFLLALLCRVAGTKILTGEEGLNKRPIKDLVDGLRQLGATIEYLEQEGFPPLRISSSQLTPGEISLKGTISSQYFSAILMIAPLVGEISIKVIGTQVSKPYIDMTIDTMKHFGVNVIQKNYEQYTVLGGQKYSATEYAVEGDYSSAGYFAAIAALTESTLTLKNLNYDSAQADRTFLDVLERMGNQIEKKDDEVCIIGKGVMPLEIDMIDCPDQIQTLAVLAAFAKGETKIHGIESLRVKETNRVVAIEQELKKMGIPTQSTEHTLTIQGGNPQPATIDTYGDHRMAMSFAVAGTKIDGIVINDPDVVNKTFPEFWTKLKEISIQIEYQNP